MPNVLRDRCQRCASLAWELEFHRAICHLPVGPLIAYDQEHRTVGGSPPCQSKGPSQAALAGRGRRCVWANPISPLLCLALAPLNFEEMAVMSANYRPSKAEIVLRRNCRSLLRQIRQVERRSTWYLQFHEVLNQWRFFQVRWTPIVGQPEPLIKV
jgi:hypothetical protein